MKNWPEEKVISNIFFPYHEPDDIKWDGVSDSDPYLVGWWSEEECGVFSANEEILKHALNDGWLDGDKEYRILDKDFVERNLEIAAVKVF